MTTQSALTQPHIEDYSHLEPLPDPPPREPDMQQQAAIWDFGAILRPHFAHRPDVLISGGGYLRRNLADTGDFVPDCVFADRVGNPKGIIRRNGYVISEVGKPPDFVLEVASRSTGRRDYTVKRDGYAAYGVREYWRFDHTGGRYHDAPLAGDTLVDGVYEPIRIIVEPDGRHWGYSEVMGLELWWDDEQLRFRDPASGEFLPTPEELSAAHEELDAERQEAQERAATEMSARLAAERRADEAEARIQEMEAELRSLHGK